jgi:hypothetical protein
VPSTAKSVSKSDPRIVPGNCFHGATIYFFQALLNFGAPHLFINVVNICINAFDQRIDQSRARFSWKRQCNSK